jgi:N-formylglutamate amidohydrolase
MTDIFSFTEGTTPLLISIPHDGRLLMPGQADRMTDEGRAIPDTDWFVRDLYAFAIELGASLIAANYSRYVIDLNRPADDAPLYEGQLSTGLCPQKTFGGKAIYVDGESVSVSEQQQRVERYWRPYHDRIATQLVELRNEYGVALLWDAHSIASEVPMLFPGILTDLNIGTDSGNSCGAASELAVASAAAASEYSAVLNGRFTGGYITRHYGDPQNDVHAIQLELSQRTYMDEKKMNYVAASAVKVGGTIRNLLSAFIHSTPDLNTAGRE